VSFFAPHVGYSRTADGLAALDEFRDLVKALHRAGIEVILDVVYNHTTEGDHTGPTLCFRAWRTTRTICWNPTARATPTSPVPATRCEPTTDRARLILDSLRYWVAEMHVDGFRFDLASILSRDDTGRPIENPRSSGTSSPTRAGQRQADRRGLDAAGSTKSARSSATASASGTAVPRRRSELRARRPRTRPGVGHAPARQPRSVRPRRPRADQSVNFVTCHDGFTLNDLVSYDRKHNEANLEDNRDGANDNRSSNHGTEGRPTTPPSRPAQPPGQELPDPHAVRHGNAMILMGDEVRRTQLGNNNAYCQDNERSWFDWTLLERHADVRRFVRKLIRHRLLNDAHPERVGRTLTQALRRPASAGTASRSTARTGASTPTRWRSPPVSPTASPRCTGSSTPTASRCGSHCRRWSPRRAPAGGGGSTPPSILPPTSAPGRGAGGFRVELPRRDRSVVALYARIAELR